MVQIAAHLHFDNMTAKHIGPMSVPGDFPVEHLTPEYEHYHGHTIEEDMDNVYEEGLSDNNDLTHSQRRRRETTISLLRYCSPWAVS
jgi:hypothetical protein